MDAQIQAEINEAVWRLRILAKDIRKESRPALRKGARIVLESVQAFAPVGTTVHKRYATPKLNNRIRAPKGMGRVVATYQPGNLERSFAIMIFRASEALFVGPLSGRKAKAKGNDGYYAHMVDRGTKHSRAVNFVRPAVKLAEGEAGKAIVAHIEKIIKKYDKA